MDRLIERIQREGVYLGGGIIKVDGFLNHQIDPNLIHEIGRTFADRFAGQRITKVMTAESSGIAPALAAGSAIGVPIIYARKKTPLTMTGQVYRAEAPSRTKGGVVPLMVPPDFLGEEDRILIVDDFLATGQTLLAMMDIIDQSGAALAGIGCVIEKVFEEGRARIQRRFNGPIVSLARIDVVDNTLRVFA